MRRQDVDQIVAFFPSVHFRTVIIKRIEIKLVAERRPILSFEDAIFLVFIEFKDEFFGRHFVTLHVRRDFLFVVVNTLMLKSIRFKKMSAFDFWTQKAVFPEFYALPLLSVYNARTILFRVQVRTGQQTI